MTDMLATPDFDNYPMHQITALSTHDLGLEVRYYDGEVSYHLAADLREHSPDKMTTHPVTREALIEPVHVPAGFHITAADLRDDGFVDIIWSHRLSEQDTGRSVFHPGWLYQTGLSADTDFGADLAIQLWTAKTFGDIPVMNGQKLLEDKDAFYDFLVNFVRFGAVIVSQLPVKAEMIEILVGKIGVIRTSNFGRIFDVKIKPEADSNAYTGEELRAHTDLATREYMPGLQFLFCLQNEAEGGYSTLSDGFAVADYLKKTDKKSYQLLCERPLDFANKAETSDYRMAVPLFHLNGLGALDEVRWTSWLRAPLRGNFEEMNAIYNAQKQAYILGNSSEFKVEFKLKPGDMMCFDNRRILHGRTAFVPDSGARWLRGCYMEREELWSGLRIAARRRRAENL